MCKAKLQLRIAQSRCTKHTYAAVINFIVGMRQAIVKAGYFQVFNALYRVVTILMFVRKPWVRRVEIIQNMAAWVIRVFITAIRVHRKIIALRAIGPAHILVNIIVAKQRQHPAQSVKATFVIWGACKNSWQLVRVRIRLPVQRIVKNNLLPNVQ